MIYSTKLIVTVDTSKNKLVILTDDKRRIAITPVTRAGADVYFVSDDRPSVVKPASAALLVRLIAQALIDKKAIRKLAKESE